MVRFIRSRATKASRWEEGSRDQTTWIEIPNITSSVNISVWAVVVVYNKNSNFHEPTLLTHLILTPNLDPNIYTVSF